MRVIEITHENKELVCEELKRAKEALYKIEHIMKESYMESDNRMWRAEGDYRGMGNYRTERYDDPREYRRYKDDFRYRC